VGTIKPGYRLIKSDGTALGTIMQIQDAGKTLEQAKRGEKIAISIKGGFTVGRQVQEGDTLLVRIPDNDIFLLKSKFAEEFSEDELALMDKVYRLLAKDLGLL
jgi:translation initiation factor 5B